MVVERASKECDRSEKKKRLNCGARIDLRKLKISIGRPETKKVTAKAMGQEAEEMNVLCTKPNDVF